MAGSFVAEDYIGLRVMDNYRRIISRILEIDRFAHLKKLVLELFQNPELTFLRQATTRAEILYKAEFITDIGEFQDYLRGLSHSQSKVFILAAPGSRMHDHHSYPGGLVYHTAADIELALGMADVYQQIYPVQIDKEILIIALALHDIAKATVFPWNEEGEYPAEIMVAGTEGHHIFSMGEAIYRGLPPTVIQAMAFCHNRVNPPEKGLENYLKAAYILAGKDYPADSIGGIRLEDWICLMADSDWPMSSWTMRQFLAQQSLTADRCQIYRSLAHRSEFSIFG